MPKDVKSSPIHDNPLFFGGKDITCKDIVSRSINAAIGKDISYDEAINHFNESKFNTVFNQIVFKLTDIQKNNNSYFNDIEFVSKLTANLTNKLEENIKDSKTYINKFKPFKKIHDTFLPNKKTFHKDLINKKNSDEMVQKIFDDTLRNCKKLFEDITNLSNSDKVGQESIYSSSNGSEGNKENNKPQIQTSPIKYGNISHFSQSKNSREI